MQMGFFPYESAQEWTKGGQTKNIDGLKSNILNTLNPKQFGWCEISNSKNVHFHLFCVPSHSTAYPALLMQT